jgi:hypothetical protein
MHTDLNVKTDDLKTQINRYMYILEIDYQL